MFYCRNCKELTAVYKSQEILSPSPIIVFSLQRFKNNRKIYTHVDFPLEGLDMSKYLCSKSPQKQSQDLMYDLYATINHTGGLNGGHYFANCKVNKTWHNFDDSFVSQRDPQNIVDSSAYVLFYKKRGFDPETKDDFMQIRQKPDGEFDYLIKDRLEEVKVEHKDTSARKPIKRVMDNSNVG